MKITFDWLKEYVDIDYNPNELVDKLTMLGLEVEALENQSWDFNGVVVGQILKKVNHQESDHLWICEVDIGKRRLSIVCGAPNVMVGQKVPVAQEGSVLPGGKTIQPCNIRGVISQGTICSEAELGISSRSEGVMVLEDQAVIGSKLNQVIGTGEIVIDIDVTPNRPDCLGVIGIAREIAAIAGTALKKPKVSLAESNQPINDLIRIDILDSEKCPRYSARFIGNVTIKPSPWWLTQKLEAVGMRSINNIVDATNYVMLETGQPLHAFDYDLIKDRQVIVKTAVEGEGFTTLDDKSHTLRDYCLMICDAERAIAIGGVMGGLNSEVTDTTKNLLLESAYFDPVNIRLTSKFLNISSEASRRFERGTDPNGTLYALERVTQLIMEFSGGEVAQGFVDVYPRELKPQKIELRPDRVHHVLGTEITRDEIKTILSSLEFGVHEAKNFEVEVPTFRPDVTREADLIEEVARLYGYDNIPADTKATIEQLQPNNLVETFTKNVRNDLISFGFLEVVTYSMISWKYATVFSSDKEIIQLSNPLSEDLSNLRPSLIPGLLNVIRWNINRKNSNLKIFEIGNVFANKNQAGLESTKVAGAITGSSFVESWETKPKEVDFYELKGYVEELLERNFINNWDFINYENPFTDRQTLGVKINDKFIGSLGEIKKQILQEFDLEKSVFVFEFDFSILRENVNWNRVYSPIPKFPAINRDMALVVNNEINAADIAREIEANGGKFLQQVKLFDVYSGKQVGTGFKSLAFNLTFYSMGRTLTEEEVDKQINLILKELSKKYSARLRD